MAAAVLSDIEIQRAGLADATTYNSGQITATASAGNYSTVYAIGSYTVSPGTAALTGDKSHQVAFRAALRERAAVTTRRLNAIPGMSCVAPLGAFYAMPQVSLPPGRTDQLVLTRKVRACCSQLPAPAVAGLIIDDLRVE